jgi:TonB family protein
MMDSFLNTFANAWYSHGAIQLLGEGLLISAFVLAVFVLLDRLLRAQLSTQSQHLVILGGFVSVFLGFSMSQTQLPSTGDIGAAPALVTLTVYPGAVAQTSIDWGTLLLTLYLAPVLLLISRLLLGLWQLHRVRAASEPIENTWILAEVERLQHRLKITRNVSVRTSTLIHSPLSYGALRPLILLPLEALQWPEQTLRHVLSHELSHVHRCDWLSKLLCYVVAGFLWLNPLCWRLLRRLDSCAESACDMQAAAIENDNADYATTLLSVARRCQQHAEQPLLFAQKMLDRSTLETRIVHLLEGKTMQTKELKKERRNVLLTLGLLSTFLMVTLANTQIVSAQPSASNSENREPPATRSAEDRGEFLPLENIIPMYPTVAAADGIEGWVQVKFTVGVDGLVVADSVEIVDSEPAGVFNNSAIAATKKFRFTRYTPDGFPVMVPNVQYVFRYQLHDESN